MTRIPVSKRTLVVRVRRKLKSQEVELRAARDQRTRLNVGDFYLVNTRINGVVGQNIDLESYARELGVLKPYEFMQEQKEKR